MRKPQLRLGWQIRHRPGLNMAGGTLDQSIVMRGDTPGFSRQCGGNNLDVRFNFRSGKAAGLEYLSDRRIAFRILPPEAGGMDSGQGVERNGRWFQNPRRKPKRGRKVRASSPRLLPDYSGAASTALRIVRRNLSMPSPKAAEMGSTGVLGTRRLNFLRFTTAAGSSILFATTRRGLAARASS